MNIRVNTDSHITGKEDFLQKYAAELDKKIERFSEYITTVEIFFADENKGKSGTDDKKCTIEVRLKNNAPEAVSHNASTIALAFNGAVDKVRSLLDTKVGKMHAR